MAIAKNLASATVGDKVWLFERWGRAGSTPELRTVRKVARTYLYVDAGENPDRWDGYSRETGVAKPHNGFTGSVIAAGAEERAAQAWRAMTSDMSRAVLGCHDVEVLGIIALALGMAPPPDFSIEPEAPSA